MNKGEFISFISKENNISKAEAERMLNLIVSSITEAIGKELQVNLMGFGSFYVQKRAAREGRNPRTRETIQIEAYSQPAFKAGKRVKDACNHA